MIRSLIARRKPVRKVNPKRKAARFERDYGGEKADWVRDQPCCIPGCQSVTDEAWRTTREAAHAKSRGAGGTSAHLVPLCYHHHNEQHQHGIRTLNWKYGIDLLALAADFERRWRQRLSTEKGSDNGES